MILRANVRNGAEYSFGEYTFQTQSSSVEPKVRLEGYGYNPFCSHSSRCLAVLVWQHFEEAFCAPKVRLKWYGLKGFPSHSSHALGAFFHSIPGSAQLSEFFGGSLSFGERTQWVPLGLLFVCQSELAEFSQNSPSLPRNSVRLSEFSSLKQYSRNSIPPVF